MKLTRTRTLIAAGVLAVPLLAAACSTDPEGHTDTHASTPTVAASEASAKQDELRIGLHRLWEDHIAWTRLYILAAADASPATDLVAKRLLKNQDDIGNAIKPIYGDAAGTELTRLLKEHILVAADLVGAAKAGDTAKVTTTKATWYANGDQVADFLAGANPEHWPATETRPMMREHLDHTLNEAVHRLQGDFAADIADWDLIHTQILHMADMLADGIIAQHPDKFGPLTKPSKPTELRLGLHRLWEDHIVWTRLFILAAADGAKDTDLVAQRLLKNQDDIGDAIKPIYGDAAGTELTRLLKEHILVAADLVGAAKAGDTAKVTTTKTTWYANADSIAEFLAQANPENWPATEGRTMMHEHLDHTLNEAVHRLQGDFAADIADYDLIHTQILHMADMLANGIIAQHPDKFA